jgi:hypothetical protein
VSFVCAFENSIFFLSFFFPLRSILILRVCLFIAIAFSDVQARAVRLARCL